MCCHLRFWSAGLALTPRERSLADLSTSSHSVREWVSAGAFYRVSLCLSLVQQQHLGLGLHLRTSAVAWCEDNKTTMTTITASRGCRYCVYALSSLPYHSNGRARPRLSISILFTGRFSSLPHTANTTIVSVNEPPTNFARSFTVPQELCCSRKLETGERELNSQQKLRGCRQV